MQTTPVLNKRSPVELKIKQAKIKLLFNQPFFGTLIMHLPLVDATDAGWCPTAAVDGRNIYYNREFFAKLDVDETQFVLCHEVLHVAFDHFGRRSHRDASWWNMANDYVINGTLIKDKIGKMPTERVPVETTDGNGKKTQAQRVGLYDEKYVGWTSEAVYDDLEKRIEKLAAEEELAAIRPDLDGAEVMQLLNLKPSREIGLALDFLLELRLEHGPLGKERATEELFNWWKSR